MGMVPVQPPSAPDGYSFCPAGTRNMAGVLTEGECIMKTLLAAVLLVVTVLICPTLGAGGGEGLAERIQDLNLTDAQEAKIAEIRKECRTKIQQTDKELAT